MNLLSIFKGNQNKKEKDCCQIEIIEIKDAENNCCSGNQQETKNIVNNCCSNNNKK
ncbi:hypothetical protein [Rummeliibacillus suwonensis]|uniref:hypothetical protein n=1 Tax=Rummeliibacillus suwonensis TaxID=1306154 RepID=UPI001AB01CA2|nr:hypothetical protein [Rummeliibacillus suwonensis]MBO2537230.1 hypothetical protein [Rummeliibacillus suwonensis]